VWFSVNAAVLYEKEGTANAADFFQIHSYFLQKRGIYGFI